MEKIRIGMKLYLEPTGKIAKESNKIQEVRVIKTGPYYFVTSNEEVFDTQTLKNINNDYESAWIAHFSREEIYKEKEKNRLLHVMKKSFDEVYRNLSLEQLQKIAEIINI